MSTSTIVTQQSIPGHATRNGSAWKMLVNTGRSVARRLNLIYDVYGERRQMQNLSDEMLSDLGITRAQLNEECSRSITDTPTNRN